MFLGLGFGVDEAPGTHFFGKVAVVGAGVHWNAEDALGCFLVEEAGDVGGDQAGGDEGGVGGGVGGGDEARAEPALKFGFGGGMIGLEEVAYEIGGFGDGEFFDGGGGRMAAVGIVGGPDLGVRVLELGKVRDGFADSDARERRNSRVCGVVFDDIGKSVLLVDDFESVHRLGKVGKPLSNLCSKKDHSWARLRDAIFSRLNKTNPALVVHGNQSSINELDDTIGYATFPFSFSILSTPKLGRNETLDVLQQDETRSIVINIREECSNQRVFYVISLFISIDTREPLATNSSVRSMMGGQTRAYHGGPP